ncbi:unnamed protein product [Amoebophrya sp. A120]|nr:unnamed protein product [Amoebophrya sp. A120]|eukprot:GSA120T00011903001.1
MNLDVKPEVVSGHPANVWNREHADKAKKEREWQAERNSAVFGVDTSPRNSKQSRDSSTDRNSRSQSRSRSPKSPRSPRSSKSPPPPQVLEEEIIEDIKDQKDKKPKRLANGSVGGIRRESHTGKVVRTGSPGSLNRLHKDLPTFQFPPDFSKGERLKTPPAKFSGSGNLDQFGTTWQSLTSINEQTKPDPQHVFEFGTKLTCTNLDPQLPFSTRQCGLHSPRETGLTGSACMTVPKPLHIPRVPEVDEEERKLPLSGCVHKRSFVDTNDILVGAKKMKSPRASSPVGTSTGEQHQAASKPKPQKTPMPTYTDGFKLSRSDEYLRSVLGDLGPNASPRLGSPSGAEKFDLFCLAPTGPDLTGGLVQHQHQQLQEGVDHLFSGTSADLLAADTTSTLLPTATATGQGIASTKPAPAFLVPDSLSRRKIVPGTGGSFKSHSPPSRKFPVKAAHHLNSSSISHGKKFQSSIAAKSIGSWQHLAPRRSLEPEHIQQRFEAALALEEDALEELRKTQLEKVKKQRLSRDKVQQDRIKAKVTWLRNLEDSEKMEQRLSKKQNMLKEERRRVIAEANTRLASPELDRQKAVDPTKVLKDVLNFVDKETFVFDAKTMKISSVAQQQGTGSTGKGKGKGGSGAASAAGSPSNKQQAGTSTSSGAGLVQKTVDSAVLSTGEVGEQPQHNYQPQQQPLVQQRSVSFQLDPIEEIPRSESPPDDDISSLIHDFEFFAPPSPEGEGGSGFHDHLSSGDNALHGDLRDATNTKNTDFGMRASSWRTVDMSANAGGDGLFSDEFGPLPPMRRGDDFGFDRRPGTASSGTPSSDERLGTPNLFPFHDSTGGEAKIATSSSSSTGDKNHANRRGGGGGNQRRRGPSHDRAMLAGQGDNQQDYVEQRGRRGNRVDQLHAGSSNRSAKKATTFDPDLGFFEPAKTPSKHPEKQKHVDMMISSGEMLQIGKRYMIFRQPSLRRNWNHWHPRDGRRRHRSMSVTFPGPEKNFTGTSFLSTSDRFFDEIQRAPVKLKTAKLDMRVFTSVKWPPDGAHYRRGACLPLAYGREPMLLDMCSRDEQKVLARSRTPVGAGDIAVSRHDVHTYPNNQTLHPGKRSAWSAGPISVAHVTKYGTILPEYPSVEQIHYMTKRVPILWPQEEAEVDKLSHTWSPGDRYYLAQERDVRMRAKDYDNFDGGGGLNNNGEDNNTDNLITVTHGEVVSGLTGGTLFDYDFVAPTGTGATFADGNDALALPSGPARTPPMALPGLYNFYIEPVPPPRGPEVPAAKVGLVLAKRNSKVLNDDNINHHYLSTESVNSMNTSAYQVHQSMLEHEQKNSVFKSHRVEQLHPRHLTRNLPLKTFINLKPEMVFEHYGIRPELVERGVRINAAMNIRTGEDLDPNELYFRSKGMRKMQHEHRVDAYNAVEPTLEPFPILRLPQLRERHKAHERMMLQGIQFPGAEEADVEQEEVPLEEMPLGMLVRANRQKKEELARIEKEEQEEAAKLAAAGGAEDRDELAGAATVSPAAPAEGEQEGGNKDAEESKANPNGGQQTILEQYKHIRALKRPKRKHLWHTDHRDMKAISETYAGQHGVLPTLSQSRAQEIARAIQFSPNTTGNSWTKTSQYSHSWETSSSAVGRSDRGFTPAAEDPDPHLRGTGFEYDPEKDARSPPMVYPPYDDLFDDRRYKVAMLLLERKLRARARNMLLAQRAADRIAELEALAAARRRQMLENLGFFDKFGLKGRHGFDDMESDMRNNMDRKLSAQSPRTGLNAAGLDGKGPLGVRSRKERLRAVMLGLTLAVEKDREMRNYKPIDFTKEYFGPNQEKWWVFPPNSVFAETLNEPMRVLVGLFAREQVPSAILSASLPASPAGVRVASPSGRGAARGGAAASGAGGAHQPESSLNGSTSSSAGVGSDVYGSSPPMSPNSRATTAGGQVDFTIYEDATYEGPEADVQRQENSASTSPQQRGPTPKAGVVVPSTPTSLMQISRQGTMAVVNAGAAASPTNRGKSRQQAKQAREPIDIFKDTRSCAELGQCISALVSVLSADNEVEAIGPFVLSIPHTQVAFKFRFLEKLKALAEHMRLRAKKAKIVDLRILSLLLKMCNTRLLLHLDHLTAGTALARKNAAIVPGEMAKRKAARLLHMAMFSKATTDFDAIDQNTARPGSAGNAEERPGSGIGGRLMRTMVGASPNREATRQFRTGGATTAGSGLLETGTIGGSTEDSDDPGINDSLISLSKADKVAMIQNATPSGRHAVNFLAKSKTIMRSASSFSDTSLITPSRAGTVEFSRAGTFNSDAGVTTVGGIISRGGTLDLEIDFDAIFNEMDLENQQAEKKSSTSGSSPRGGGAGGSSSPRSVRMAPSRSQSTLLDRVFIAGDEESTSVSNQSIATGPSEAASRAAMRRRSNTTAIRTDFDRTTDSPIPPVVEPTPRDIALSQIQSGLEENLSPVSRRRVNADLQPGNIKGAVVSSSSSPGVATTKGEKLSRKSSFSSTSTAVAAMSQLGGSGPGATNKSIARGATKMMTQGAADMAKSGNLKQMLAAQATQEQSLSETLEKQEQDTPLYHPISFLIRKLGLECARSASKTQDLEQLLKEAAAHPEAAGFLDDHPTGVNLTPYFLSLMAELNDEAKKLKNAKELGVGDFRYAMDESTTNALSNLSLEVTLKKKALLDDIMDKEWKVKVDQVWNMLDDDRSGYVIRAEMQAHYSAALKHKSVSAQVQQIFDDIDANGDGLISYDEWTLYFADMVKSNAVTIPQLMLELDWFLKAGGHAAIGILGGENPSKKPAGGGKAEEKKKR